MTARKLTIAKRCIVCGHPDRVLIEAARVAGCSLDTIAAKHSISRDAIFRHMKNHVDDAARADYLANIPMKDLAAKAAEEGVSVLQYFSVIRGILMSQFQLAASVNDRNATATFKQAKPEPNITEYQREQLAIRSNFERLKSERLAREAAASSE